MKTNKKNIISDIWVFYGSDNESKLESQRFQITELSSQQKTEASFS